MTRTLLSLAVLFCSAAYSGEVFPGACVNLEAFSDYASQTLGKDVGAHQRHVVFQDGVYSADSDPLLDGAALFYVSDFKVTVDQIDYRATLRLSLNDGKITTMLARLGNGLRINSYLDSVMITFGYGTIPEEKIKKAGEDLQKHLGPKFNVSQELTGIGILLVESRTGRAGVMAEAIRSAEVFLKNQGLSPAFSLNNEVYQMPFVFGAARDLSDFTVQNLDELRDVSRRGLQNGHRFATVNSHIPEAFKAICPFK